MPATLTRQPHSVHQSAPQLCGRGGCGLQLSPVRPAHSASHQHVKALQLACGAAHDHQPDVIGQQVHAVVP